MSRRGKPKKGLADYTVEDFESGDVLWLPNKALVEPFELQNPRFALAESFLIDRQAACEPEDWVAAKIGQDGGYIVRKLSALLPIRKGSVTIIGRCVSVMIDLTKNKAAAAKKLAAVAA